jgi:CheY-like chemotaxis protein
MVGDYLEAKRYRVEKARSAFELFERITEANPDLIIMDIQMAGMSGLDAIRAIRSRTEPFIAKIPIIAVTALAMSGDRERCLNAGANEYLSKPVKLRELAAVIKNMIGKHYE